MKKLLRKIKRFLDKVLGTKSDELYWKSRHFFNKKWAEKYISEESLNHPHRKFLIDKISACVPFENVLEIGCASGPNLYLLAKKFPNIKIYGVDISKKAVMTGQKWFQKQNIRNISLFSGRAENLSQFSDKAIDIIFTDAVLICIGPDKIKKLINEMLRVAKKAIILNEWHSDDFEHFCDDHWVHNYKLLFKKFIPEEKIKFTKLPENLWGGNWSKFGYIIEIII